MSEAFFLLSMQFLRLAQAQFVDLDGDLECQPVAAILNVDIADRLQAFQALNQRITVYVKAF